MIDQYEVERHRLLYCGYRNEAKDYQDALNDLIRNKKVFEGIKHDSLWQIQNVIDEYILLRHKYILLKEKYEELAKNE